MTTPAPEIQQLVDNGWTRHGLIWRNHALRHNEPPLDELPPPTPVGNEAAGLSRCGTDAARRRHQRRDETCYVCHPTKARR